MQRTRLVGLAILAVVDAVSFLEWRVSSSAIRVTYLPSEGDYRATAPRSLLGFESLIGFAVDL